MDSDPCYWYGGAERLTVMLYLWKARSKHCRLLGLKVSIIRQPNCRCRIKAVQYTNESVPIKFYLETLTLTFHIILKYLQVLFFWIPTVTEKYKNHCQSECYKNTRWWEGFDLGTTVHQSLINLENHWDTHWSMPTKSRTPVLRWKFLFKRIQMWSF